MVLSPKLMRALTGYWERKFTTAPETGVDAAALLATPSDSVLSDRNSIYTIVHNVRNELERIGTCENRLALYSYYGFAPIIYFFSTSAAGQFSISELDELTSEVCLCFRRGAISKTPNQQFLKAVKIIKSYHVKGYLDERDHTTRKGYKIELSDEFDNLIRFYADNIGDYRCLSASTLSTRCGTIRSFLAQLERQGINKVKDLSYPIISDCITQISPNYSRGTKCHIDVARHFLWFLHQSGVTSVDFSLAIPDTLPRKRVIRNGFSDSEISQLLNIIDKNSLNGKRDYAFLLIAARTGLRGSDIINLKFESIDWRLNEMRIVQQKTGNVLNLPLSPEVGNAIANYILNERPKSNSNHIFVKRFNPSQSISCQSISAVAKKYMKLAKIDSENIPRRGLHSFRRSFGKSLLESSLPIDIINELLGHADMNSSRSYLAIDENGLRNCALNLVSFEVGGETGAI